MHHRRLADASLVTLAALLGALFYADSLRNGQNFYPVLDLVIGVAGCLALLLRRRFPVTIALLLIPTILISASAMGATAVVMSAVASYRSHRVTAVVFGLHALLLTGIFSLVAEHGRDFWEGLIVILALDVAFIASGLLVRSQGQLVELWRDRAREAEEGQRLRVEEARHLERERIAREMHDSLAHRLSLLAVHAGALEIRKSAPVEEREAAGVIRQSAFAAIEDLRAVIGMLRDDTADSDRPQPTLTDLPLLVEQSRLAGTAVTLDNQLTESASTVDGVGRHVYRIVQEGLTNARKHAPGVAVHIAITGPEPGGGLTVEVSNPLSAGSTPIPGTGTGLIGLRERMHLLGGRLEHGHAADGRFRLHAWIPWRP